MFESTSYFLKMKSATCQLANGMAVFKQDFYTLGKYRPSK